MFTPEAQITLAMYSFSSTVKWDRNYFMFGLFITALTNYVALMGRTDIAWFIFFASSAVTFRHFVKAS